MNLKKMIFPLALTALLSGCAGLLVSSPSEKTSVEETLRRDASIGNLASVQKILKEAMVDVDDKNEQGDTALMMAATDGNLDIVNALLDAGADVNIENADGRTAYSMASHYSHKKVAARLLKAGAKPTT